MAYGIPETETDWLTLLNPEEKDEWRDALGKCPYPERAVRQTSRLIDRLGSPLPLLAALRDDPASRDALFFLLSVSGFLSQTLFLHPEYLEYITSRQIAGRPKGARWFRTEIQRTFEPFFSLSSRLDALRRLRRRETFRVAVADLLGLMDLEEVIGEISDLAEGIISSVFDLLFPDADGLLVVAYGKLGARELNYSSDVDLAFYCQGSSDRWEPHFRRFVSLMTEVTGFGRLFRVDFRLRPYGESGPIILPLDAAFTYYEGWGDPMDRVALLKARAIAGDKQLSERFDDFRQSWVFSRPLEPEELVWILRTRQRMERAVSSLSFFPAAGESIKHGPGGIRDVEFCTQTLQLTFAFQKPDLAIRDTLSAIGQLEKVQLLTSDEARVLSSGYRFLRRLEHRLQLIEDLPQWHLPTDPKDLTALARAMGEPGSATFLEKLEDHRRQVRRIYESVTGELKRSVGALLDTEIGVSAASAVPGPSPSSVNGDLTGWERLEKRLNHLVGAVSVPLPWRHRLGLMRVLPVILKEAMQTYDTEKALLGLERIAEAAGSGTSFLTNLSQNRVALRGLLLVLSVSEWLCQLMVQHPEHLELLLSEVLDTVNGFQWRLTGADRVVPQEQAEREMMRHLSRGRLFLGYGSLTGRLSAEEAGIGLASLADSVAAFFLSFLKSSLSVFGLGGWGSGEIHFGSDLDAAFASHHWSPKVEEEGVLLTRLMSGESVGESGYRLDLRLRPGGQQGALVHSIDAWRSWAGPAFEPWMALPWTRLRFVAGDPLIGQKLTEEVRNRIYKVGMSAEQWESLLSLLKRIRDEHRPAPAVTHLKHSPGGLWDIELTVSLRQLRDGHQDLDITHCALRQVIKRLTQRDRRWKEVADGYTWLRQLRLWISAMEPKQEPSFLQDDLMEKKLAWLACQTDPLRERKPIEIDSALEAFRQRLRAVTSRIWELVSGEGI